MKVKRQKIKSIRLRSILSEECLLLVWGVSYQFLYFNIGQEFNFYLDFVEHKRKFLSELFNTVFGKTNPHTMYQFINLIGMITPLQFKINWNFYNHNFSFRFRPQLELIQVKETLPLTKGDNQQPVKV